MILDGRFLLEVALPCCSYPPGSRPPRARNRFSAAATVAVTATDPLTHTAGNGRNVSLSLSFYIYILVYVSVCMCVWYYTRTRFLTFEFLVNTGVFYDWAGERELVTENKKKFILSFTVRVAYNMIFL